jgi:hypothetical protein
LGGAQLAALQGGEDDVLDLVAGGDEPNRHLGEAELEGGAQAFVSVEDDVGVGDLEWVEDAAAGDVGAEAGEVIGVIAGTSSACGCARSSAGERKPRRAALVLAAVRFG